MRPYLAAIEGLSKHFPGTLSKPGAFFNQPKFNGTYGEHKFSVTFVTSEKIGCVVGLEMVCRFRSSSKLKVFMYERNPGPVLFAERILVGDLDFGKYYIYSNMPEEAKRYLADASRRTNIKKMVTNGWQLPMISGGRIYTHAVDKRPRPVLDPEMIRTTLDNMIALRIAHIP